MYQLFVDKDSYFAPEMEGEFQSLEEAQEAKKAQEAQQEKKKKKETSETDKDQEIKASLANATSSMIMADYMKYYHLMS